MKRASAIDLFIHKDKVALTWACVALLATGGFWWERQRLVKEPPGETAVLRHGREPYLLPPLRDGLWGS